MSNTAQIKICQNADNALVNAGMAPRFEVKLSALSKALASAMKRNADACDPVWDKEQTIFELVKEANKTITKFA